IAACAAPEPTATIAPSPTTAPPPTSAPTAAPVAAGNRIFAIVADQSEVTLKVQEQLADAVAVSDAVFTTKAIKGQVVVDREGKVVGDGSKFTVDLSTLKSDRGMRDDFIKRSTLRTSQFPNAEFAPNEL